MSEFDFQAFKELDNDRKENDLASDDEEIIVDKIEKDREWRKCKSCDVYTVEQDFVLICPKCGVEVESIDSTTENYSYTKSSNVTKLSGKNAHTWNKSLKLFRI
jgi:predicted RNA-binding Zn-ribbon protein involved in translation (DUF1610 family)